MTLLPAAEAVAQVFAAVMTVLMQAPASEGTGSIDRAVVVGKSSMPVSLESID